MTFPKSKRPRQKESKYNKKTSEKDTQRGSYKTCIKTVRPKYSPEENVGVTKDIVDSSIKV